MFKQSFLILFVCYFSFSGAFNRHLESDILIPLLKYVIHENADLVKGALKGAVIHAIITKNDVPVSEYTADFSNLRIVNQPPVPGVHVDSVFTIDDLDFSRIIRGNFDGEYAYASGKLIIKGNLEVALAMYRLLQENRDKIHYDI